MVEPMFEALPPHVRKAFLENNCIRSYFEGRTTIVQFHKNLPYYFPHLKEQNVDDRYLTMLMSIDGETEFNRKAANSRFVRFCRQLGLDIATPEDKIRMIKATSAHKFLDILSISSGLLRGAISLQKWKDRNEDKAIVSSSGGVVEIDPPDHPEIEFDKFYVHMQKNLTVQNVKLWACKLYFAIIFSHMFPNGNGRLGRNAYFMLTSSGLLDEQKSSQRGSQIGNMCLRINHETITQLLHDQGIIVDDILNLRADETWDGKDFIVPDYKNTLKYIAVRRLLQRHNRLVEKTQLGAHDLAGISQHEFNHEYQQVRIEWFWKSLEVVAVYHEYVVSVLDSIATK